MSKILFKDTRAIGVQYPASSGPNISNVFASREVILAAGALHTPQLLQLSGVGPKKVLKPLGIPLVAELQPYRIMLQ